MVPNNFNYVFPILLAQRGPMDVKIRNTSEHQKNRAYGDWDRVSGMLIKFIHAQEICVSKRQMNINLTHEA